MSLYITTNGGAATPMNPSQGVSRIDVGDEVMCPYGPKEGASEVW